MAYQLFTDKRPFAVVDCATGQTIARFSNLPAAFASAKALAREYRRGLDVVQDGQKLSHCEVPSLAQERMESETLP
jgi:hypothetical protein